jgi:hypothetical protein
VDELTARTVAVSWRKAGRRLGLSGPGLFKGLQLDGFIGCFGVRVEQRDDRTRILVRDERPAALSGLRWRAGGGRGGSVATGDDAFDDRVSAWGDPLLVAAFFGASRRRLILRASSGGGGFEEGALTLDRPGLADSAAALVSDVRRALALARRMTTPRDVAACLAANAVRDPVPAVRISCLERLHESYPGRGPRVLGVARGDRDPRVRLRAATLSPEDGRPTLLALARDFRLDEGVQAEAVAALVRPSARGMSGIFRAAIRRRRAQVALEAVSALGRSRSRTALVPLVPLTRAANGFIRLAAIRALAASGQPGAQAALVGVLGSEPGEAREAAAEGLGILGTVTAVAPLRAAVAAHPLDRRLRRAAARAIAAIQARASGAEAGQLSIANESVAGALSLASGETGQLSLAPEGTSPASRGRGSRKRPERGRLRARESRVGFTGAAGGRAGSPPPRGGAPSARRR